MGAAPVGAAAERQAGAGKLVNAAMMGLFEKLSET